MRHDCGIWKSIIKVKETFWRFIRFQLGYGHNINFWNDLWIGRLF